jgi:hypothetical protein
LHLQDRLHSTVDETVRLALLAWLTTTFQVAGQPARYLHLEQRFREFCRALPIPAPAELTMWLLSVCAMAVSRANSGKEDENWITDMWKTRVMPLALDWEAAHAILMAGYPWIRFIHDEPARALFEMLTSKAAEMDTQSNLTER